MQGAPHVFLIAGESSGDQLGAELMAALKRKTGGQIGFSGIGGPLMQAEGLVPLFPSSDIALMGPSAILAHFPLLLRRLRETVQAVLTAAPHVLVIIDSPEFTQRVARRVRKQNPGIPIIKYVAPQVWAWRPKRAAKMRGYIDEILAVLPFEPQRYAELDGPRTTYVGHPLLARKDLWQLRPEDERARETNPHVIAILPGSRSSEVKLLLKPFGETLARLKETQDFQAVLPVVPHLRDYIAKETSRWPVPVTLLEGRQAKWALFRRARVALAASGTVTLELALAQVPMIACYKVENWVEPILRRLIVADSIVLPNLILGTKAVPEFYQGDVCADILAPQLERLLTNQTVRQTQLNALHKLYAAMQLPNGQSPGEAAAGRVLTAART